jgi:hypothetical protein
MISDEMVRIALTVWYQDEGPFPVKQMTEMRAVLETVVGCDDLKAYARGFKDGYREGEEASK